MVATIGTRNVGEHGAGGATRAYNAECRSRVEDAGIMEIY